MPSGHFGNGRSALFFCLSALFTPALCLLTARGMVFLHFYIPIYGKFFLTYILIYGKTKLTEQRRTPNGAALARQGRPEGGNRHEYRARKA